MYFDAFYILLQLQYLTLFPKLPPIFKIKLELDGKRKRFLFSVLNIVFQEKPRGGNAVAIMWWGFWAKFAGDIGWFTTTRSPY